MRLPLPRLAGAVASGLLLAALFPRLDQGYLAWLALVPLLLAVRGVPLRKAAGLGWTCGFVFFAITLYWVPSTISNFTSISPLLAAGILALMAAAAAYSHALFAVALEWLAARGVSRVLAAPLVWVILEWMRCFVVAEFPWNLLGYSQLGYLSLAQAADLGGVYLLSAVIVLANAALAEAAWGWRRSGVPHAGESWMPLATRRAFVALAVACPVLLFVYGEVRLASIDATPYTGSLRVGVAQGNIAQDQKWDAALLERIFARYLDLTNQAADAGAQLVVWPEAALPFYIQRDMRSVELVRLARERHVDLLVGAPGLENRDGSGLKDYNQAWLVRNDGSLQGPYDKIQLVPFGEYIPLYGLFGLVDIAVETVGQMGRGSEHTIFETVDVAMPAAAASQGANQAANSVPVTAMPASALPKPTSVRPARFATLICYEGIFPGFVRSFAADGADFLVNISNDAWYGDTAAAEQHLVMASMRAIENRLPLVRSTNTGISAFVTDEGKIGPATPLFHEEVVVETVLLRDVWSFYRLYGDVFLHLCQVALVGLAMLAWKRGKARAAA